MKYGISYDVVYEMYVEVEAEDSNLALDFLLTSNDPATDVYGYEPTFVTKRLGQWHDVEEISNA